MNGQNGNFATISNSLSYNPRLQPVTMSAASPAATVFSIGYDFHLDNGGNANVFGITNNRDTTRSQSFAYDFLNRLTSAQNSGTNCNQMTANGKTEYWGNSYGYDAWGNLLQKNVTKCSAENLSVSALSNNQLSGYGYDAAGNMTHDSSTNVNYTFDAENRITGAAGYTYTYDADGNRVEKSNGSTGTIYWYMSPGIVAESDLSGNLKSEYVFFDGERVARKDFSGGATSVSYYFSDHLKTASVITNSAGVITEDEDYYPWGGELQFVNSDSNHYKFTGKERDSETGLDYFGARYYGSWYGRFLSADWSAKPEAVPYSDLHDPQSLNLYSYVRNVPTSKTDSDGHDPDPDITFATPEIERQYNNIASESPGFAQEIQAERDDHNMQVNVVQRGVKQNAEKSKADTTFEFHPDGTVTATVYLDNVYPRDTDIEHEHGHVRDARQNRPQFLKDAKKSQDKNDPNRLSHNDRPEEKRADQFKDQVERERKEYQKQQKRKREQEKRKQKHKEQ